MQIKIFVQFSTNGYTQYMVSTKFNGIVCILQELLGNEYTHTYKTSRLATDSTIDSIPVSA